VSEVEQNKSSVMDAYHSEEYWQFKFKLFSSIMVIAMLFAVGFGLMHDLGLNKVGTLQARLDYGYAALSLVLLVLLRINKDSYSPLLYIFLLASFITFVGAIMNVPIDQFRAIWLYLLVLVAYILAGTGTGLVLTVVSVIAVIVLSLTMQVAMNPETLVTTIGGLLVLSLIAYIHTDRMISYARLIEENNSKLKQLASQDPLTGLFNPRMCSALGEQLMKIAIRENKPFSVVYIDLDHFKQINDEYGHQAGDNVLVSIAEIIGGYLRDSDVCARLGGEEFCALLPDTDRDGAQQLAENIREQIEKTVHPLGKNELKVTASFGVAQLLATDHNLMDIQKRADQALYAAKKGGRNKVDTSVE
jgi:diguanylate cyclase (GGDEF)-like protein